MVYILGCNHGIQQETVGDNEDTAQVRAEQRTYYKQLIDEIVREGDIRLICEEWPHEGGRTVAHRIADRCGLQWISIDTTPEQLRGMGIATPLYIRLPIPREKKAMWHSMREEVMVCKIKKKRVDAQNLLVVCGFDHMLPLSDRLREGIGGVKIVDYRKMGWYRPGVFLGDSCNPAS